MIGCRREKAVISQACDSDDDGRDGVDDCEDARRMSHLRICHSLTGKDLIMSGTRLILADEVANQISNYYS